MLVKSLLLAHTTGGVIRKRLLPLLFLDDSGEGNTTFDSLASFFNLLLEDF